MRMLLVDDEPLALRRLAHALKSIADVEIVGTACDGEAALYEMRRLKPDLVILDVEMPERDGLAVAAEIERENGTEIIILSAFDRYAASAFDVEAIDYLLKPLDPDRLRQALQRARRRRAEKAAHESMVGRTTQAEEPALHIPNRHGGKDIFWSDIIWIEAARDYALIHTIERSHIMRITMAQLAKRVPESILRVHRSAFVALSNVRRWGTPSKGIHTLVLSDGTEVAVGPSYLTDARAALRSLDH
jgi:DNA-binding LytR/AlgR family response regulator